MSTLKAHDCAERLLSLAPRLMQTLRVEMRAGRPPELTVPQFRTLVFYDNHPGAALSEAADHLGLGMPSASKVVECMVARGFLLRTPNAQDRRRVDITLTPAGQRVLATARNEATAVFTRRLQNLSELELDVLFAVLGTLQSVIGTDSQGADAQGGAPQSGVARR
jgi:DNA-binding MarR family transcriptional regulator